jgi:hypothetical protein
MPHAPVIPAPYLIVCQIHYYSSPQNNFLARIFLIKNTLYLPKLCPAVALSRQDGRHSAVVLLLKVALIQVSDYRLLVASGCKDVI